MPTKIVCPKCRSNGSTWSYVRTWHCDECSHFWTIEQQEEIDILKAKLSSANFWNNWVYPEGATAQQIQDELQDYHELMERVSIVYEHVTDGRISKQNTLAEVVCAVADDVLEQQIKDAVEEKTEDLKAELLDCNEILDYGE